MSDDEQKSTVTKDDDKKTDKRKRTNARTKFTRLHNGLNEHVEDENALTKTLDEMLSAVENAYTELEAATDLTLT